MQQLIWYLKHWLIPSLNVTKSVIKLDTVRHTHQGLANSNSNKVNSWSSYPDNYHNHTFTGGLPQFCGQIWWFVPNQTQPNMPKQMSSTKINFKVLDNLALANTWIIWSQRQIYQIESNHDKNLLYHDWLSASHFTHYPMNCYYQHFLCYHH